MKWLDEVKEKAVFDYSSYDAMRFEDGFNVATKAISEKLNDITIVYKHSSDCSYILYDDSICDCWKSKLKELGLC